MGGKHFRDVLGRGLGVGDRLSSGPPPRASWRGQVAGHAGPIFSVAQGARTNRPDQGDRQPTKPRSKARANAISVKVGRSAGLRFLSQKLCIKAYTTNDVSRKLTIA